MHSFPHHSFLSLSFFATESSGTNHVIPKANVFLFYHSTVTFPGSIDSSTKSWKCYCSHLFHQTLFKTPSTVWCTPWLRRIHYFSCSHLFCHHSHLHHPPIINIYLQHFEIKSEWLHLPRVQDFYKNMLIPNQLTIIFFSLFPFLYLYTPLLGSFFFPFSSSSSLSLGCLNYCFLPLLHDFFTTVFPILISLPLWCLSLQQTKHPSLNPASFSSLLFPLCFVNYFYPIFYIQIANI